VTRIVVALVLCLAAAGVSGVLLGEHHGEPLLVSTVNQACGDGQTSACEDVARSSWSSFAGLPVAAYGIAFYLSLCLLLALSLFAPAEVRDTAAGIVAALLAIGLLVDLFLLGVQAFSIHAYCAFCIVTYGLGAAAFALLFPGLRSLGLLSPALGRAEGRLAAAGWVLGTVALAAAVLAADTTLAARAAHRQATLLGAPAPADGASAAAAAPATPGPAAAATGASPAAVAAPDAAAQPSGPQDAKYWQDRAQKLQATIDDPRKLEAYFSEKAQREFDAATPVPIAMDGTPDNGPAKAPVVVVEYSDFMCPYCRNLGLALAQFVPAPQTGGRVAVYFKNFPLDKACNDRLPSSTHPGACNLALGAICARYQGKFEAYHDRVMQTDFRDPTPADVARVAGEAGLNAAAIQGCLDDPKAKADLATEIAEGNRLGVNSTPTVYINGKKLPRLNDFVAVVDKEARKKGFAPLAQ
jgi:protein-disulfide isomerase